MKINYSDNSERRAWEKKWDVVQQLWGRFRTAGGGRKITMPDGALEIKGRDAELITGILKHLSREARFKFVGKKDGAYQIENLTKAHLTALYHRTKKVYATFAETYETNKIKKLDNYNEPSLINNVIRWKDKECKIRGEGSTRLFCNFIFTQPKGKIFSWDEVYDLVNNQDLVDKSNRRKIYMAAWKLNKRVKRIFGINLFVLNDKEISRNF